MRIAQMIDSLNWGGAQKMQLFLAETLRPLEIEQTVISLGPSPNSTLPALLEKNGVRVVNFPFPKLFSPGSFARLVRFLRQERFDLLHAHLTYANIIGPTAGKLSGTPVIASLRSAGTDPRYFPPRRVRIENFTLRRLATRVMGNGWEVARVGFQRTRREIDVLPNAIDPIPPIPAEQRLALRRDITGDPERPLIFSVARLSLPKGFPDLINAFAALRQTYPQAALAIAGGGTLYEQLKAQIGQMELVGHAHLLGLRQDVPHLLHAADIYVNSSHWEGLPVTVLEAMACGLPLVATAVGDTPNVVTPGTGLLVPPAQPEALTQALCKLMADSGLRQQMGRAALAHIKAHYNRAQWRRNLLELYAKVTPNVCDYLDTLDQIPLTV